VLRSSVRDLAEAWPAAAGATGRTGRFYLAVTTRLSRRVTTSCARGTSLVSRTA
jgi:hypothetical protein